MTSRARERYTRGVVLCGRFGKPSGEGTRARRRCERGATFVEYALLLGALVVPTIAGIQYVQDSAEVKVNQTATGISSRTIPSIPPTTSGGGGSSTTSTTQAPATTTTKPPATTTTSTTTTKPPATTTTSTTTTKPPATTTTTTTIAPKLLLTGKWSTTTNNSTGSGANMTWIGTALLTVANGSGTAVSGVTVTVSVECYDGSNWNSDGSATITTNSSGQATFTSTAHKSKSNQSNYASKYRFTVTKISKSGSTWDGAKSESVVNRV